MEEKKPTFEIMLWLAFFTFIASATKHTQTSCLQYNDCYSCTSHDCKWCPLDEKCYNETFCRIASQCEPDEIINSTQSCSNRQVQAYNPTFAYENVLLTSVADTSKSEKCLQKLFPQTDYRITTTVSARCSFFFKYPNCYAYVGVTHSKKTIVIAYRGSKDVKQLVEEALVSLTVPKKVFEAGGRVQVYFYYAHIQLYAKIKTNVMLLKSKYPNYKILVLGHSLGGAMASLASASLVYENVTHSDSITLYTFGMPRVGNRKYARAHDRLVPNSYRLVHYRDIVPHLPFCGSLCAGISGNKKDKPFHHGREVFYPNKNMTVGSKYTLCKGDENKACSNGLIEKHPCTLDIFTCFNDHRYYFGIEVSNYCDNILS